MLGIRFACVLLGVAALACGGGLAPDDEGEGEGGAGGEHAGLASDRPLLDGPDVDPDSVQPRVIPHPSCVGPYVVTLATDPVVPVASCNDPGALTPGTLRHAIACANELPNLDTITTTAAGTVQLNANCRTLTIKQPLNWSSSAGLTVTAVVPGWPLSPIFGDLVRVDGAGITVNINGLKLQGASGQRGVRVASGSLVINHGQITNMVNPADELGNGAGILVKPSPAGAIANLTLSKVNVANNHALVAGAMGGGLHFSGPGKLLIHSSLFESNRASNRGGGIVYAAQSVPGSAQAFITNTTITHNSTNSNTSGVSVESTASPPLRIQNSTISENTNNDVGMGIGVRSGATAIVEASTIADNNSFVVGTNAQVHVYAGTLQLHGSILRGTGPACGGVVASVVGGSDVWHDGSCPTLTGLGNTNALLGPVANNLGSCGGTYHVCKTQQPAPGSPANNASMLCFTSDQRGTARGGAPCWAGAYEL